MISDFAVFKKGPRKVDVTMVGAPGCWNVEPLKDLSPLKEIGLICQNKGSRCFGIMDINKPSQF